MSNTTDREPSRQSPLLSPLQLKDINWQHRPSVNKLLATLSTEERLQALEHALNRHPSDSFLRGHFGRTCLQSHNPQAAIEHLTQAITNQTSDPSLPFSLGLAYQQLEGNNSALPWFQQAVDVGKIADHIMVLVRAACDVHHFGIALDACKVGLSAHPTDERIQCAYPQTLALSGQPDTALTWLDNNDAANSNALAHLKYKIYTELNRDENAKLAQQEYQRRVLRSQPDYRQDALAVLNTLPNDTAKLALATHWQKTLSELNESNDFNQSTKTKSVSGAIEATALPNVAMSILVRDEIDIIEHNIRYHAAMGVSHFVVTDNGSTDGTRQALDQLSEKFSIDIIDEPSHTIDQDLWVTRMADTIKAKSDVDWIIHNDADEFWRPENGNSLPLAINVALRHAGEMQNQVGVLSCKRFNMIGSIEDTQTPGYRFYQNDFLVRKTVPLIKGEKQWNNDGSNTVARMILDKVMTRTDGLTAIDYGNHGATHELFKENCNTVTIYHFPVRTYQQFERKVKNYGESLEKNTRFAQSSSVHLRYWYQQYLDGSLQQSYESIAFKKERLAELEAHHYLERTELISSFFNHLDSD